MNKAVCSVWLVFVALLLWVPPSFGADIIIVNRDGPNEGLNDPTPVEPVGGNQGATLGEQRMNALQYAANLLGRRLQSNVPIRVYANFDPAAMTGLTCSNNAATVAVTSAAFLVSFGPGNTPIGAKSGVYYPIALGNALAGYDLSPGQHDIDVLFNGTVDSGLLCLPRTHWYYGLDGNAPPNTLDFVSTAVHELLHGLGFATYVTLNQDNALCVLGVLCLGLELGGNNAECGAFFKPTGAPESDRHPDIFSTFVLDLPGGRVGAGTTWPQMTRAQRCASQTDSGFLVWAGPSVTAAAPSVFSSGLRQGYLKLYAPDPVEIGSSIIHWEPSLAPKPLMGAFNNGAVSVANGIGIATCLLQDLGWRLSPGISCPDYGGASVPVETQPPELNKHPVAASGGGGGGGCTLVRDGRFDPLLLLLVACTLLRSFRNARRSNLTTKP